MIHSEAPPFPSAQAFDLLAGSYDAVFTESSIGRAQRAVVWERADALFPSGTRLLELNCGTGEDAVHFARRGVTVLAVDVSEAMIKLAQWKAASSGVADSITVSLCAIENIGQIAGAEFDASFSNFSGLNCVQDLRQVADDLARLVKPGSPLLFCFSTRFCVWEVIWYLLHGKPKKAFRRWAGRHDTQIAGANLSVHYPLLRQIRQQFAPSFRLVNVHGIGITVPPSYAEDWALRRPRLLKLLCRIDSLIWNWRGVRVLGDHMLIHLERVAA